MLTRNTTTEKVLTLTHPCRCKACENGCYYGSGVLVDTDIPKMAKHLGIKENTLKKVYLEKIEKFGTEKFRPKIRKEGEKQYGRCVFFSEEKGCAVHEAKPLECSIAMGCKPYGEELITWFDLTTFLDPKNPESLRQYKLYVESGGKILPGFELENLASEETRKKAESYEDLKINKDWEEELGIKDILKKEREKEEKTNGKQQQ